MFSGEVVNWFEGRNATADDEEEKFGTIQKNEELNLISWGKAQG